jgi:hypothetical protein
MVPGRAWVSVRIGGDADAERKEDRHTLSGGVDGACSTWLEGGWLLALWNAGLELLGSSYADLSCYALSYAGTS